MGFFKELRDGFRLVGEGTHTGLFKSGIRAASLSEEDLMARADVIKKDVLASLWLDSASKGASKKARDDHEELHRITLQEATEKHWLEGPMDQAEVTAAVGQ